MDPLTCVRRQFVKHFLMFAFATRSSAQPSSALEVVHGDKNSLAFPTMITVRGSGLDREWTEKNGEK